MFIEKKITQAKKENNFTCGDYTLIKRYDTHTDFVLCDGIGSGAKANIYATMCATRLLELMASGVSINHATGKIVEIMSKADKENVPYAAFSVVRIMSSGHFTLLGYDIPIPIIVSNNHAQLLEQRCFPMGKAIISESRGLLNEDTSLILLSDGVTQAGLGVLPGLGFSYKDINKFINTKLSRGYSLPELGDEIIKKAKTLCGDIHGDDTTVSILQARKARKLSLMTGPAKIKKDDKDFVEDFLGNEGKHIVCGATTAQIVADKMCVEIENISFSTSFTNPPSFAIQGIDIACEGAVTLNQVYNIIDQPVAEYIEGSVVCDICRMIHESDYITLYLGEAKNEGHENITFMQVGVLRRKMIVEKLIKKLQIMGKTVVVKRT